MSIIPKKLVEHYKSKKAQAKTEAKLAQIESELRNNSWLCDAFHIISLLDDESLDVSIRKYYCDFFLSSLTRELEGYYAYHSAFDEENALFLLVQLPAVIESNCVRESFSAKGNRVIAMPPIKTRLEPALKDIGENGYIAEYETANATLYKELNLIIAYNHRHHVAVALSRDIRDIIMFKGPVVSLQNAEIYATRDFHFADKSGKILLAHSDPRLVLCCLIATQTLAFERGECHHKISSHIVST